MSKEMYLRRMAERAVGVYYEAYPFEDFPRKEKDVMLNEIKQFFKENGIDNLNNLELTARFKDSNVSFPGNTNDRFLRDLVERGALYALSQCRNDTTLAEKIRRVIDGLNIPSELRDRFNDQFQYKVRGKKCTPDECDLLCTLILSRKMDPMSGKFIGLTNQKSDISCAEKYAKFIKDKRDLKSKIIDIWNEYIFFDENWDLFPLEKRQSMLGINARV